MENFCSHSLESRLKKDIDEDIIIYLLLYLIYLTEHRECCKKIDGGTF